MKAVSTNAPTKRHRNGIFRAFVIAVKGLRTIFTQESNFRLQIVLGLLAIGAAALLKCSVTEWLTILLCCGFVLAAEAANSVFEELVDWIHPDFHHKAGKIKDMAAAVPFIASVFSLICGLLIFAPKIWALFSHLL